MAGQQQEKMGHRWEKTNFELLGIEKSETKPPFPSNDISECFFQGRNEDCRRCGAQPQVAQSWNQVRVQRDDEQVTEVLHISCFAQNFWFKTQQPVEVNFKRC